MSFTQQLVKDPDVLLLAPYPPPFGGVATHVRDLVEVLNREGIDVGVANHYSLVPGESSVMFPLNRNPFRYWWVASKSRNPVLHYHHSTLATLFAISMALKRNHAQVRVVTIHNDYLNPLLKRRSTRRIVRRLLSSFDFVIAVSDEIRHQLDGVVSAPMIVCPAYILDERAGAVRPEAEELFPGSSPTLVVSAYEVDRTSDEADLYGLDVAARVFAELRTRQLIRLGIFIAKEPRSKRDRDYLERIIQIARSTGDAEDIRCFFGEPLKPALSESNVVYLRPSRTDGDAVSIREALVLGTPVVASDVARRPAEVSTVPIDDEAAWVSAIDDALLAKTSPVLSPRDQAGVFHTDLFTASDYVDLYRRLIQDAVSSAG